MAPQVSSHWPSTAPAVPGHNAQQGSRACLIYLLLRGVEREVPHIERGGRLQAVLKLLLRAVKATVPILADDRVELLRRNGVSVRHQALLLYVPLLPHKTEQS